MNQNNIGVQPPKKDNTLKIVLIIVGSVAGVAIIGIAGFIFLMYTIFNKSIELYEETKDEVFEQYDNNSSGDSENNYNEDDYSSEPNKEPVQEYDNIHKVDYKTFKEMIENKESFVIVISQTSCGHCITYKPIFDEALRENNIKGYELDLQVTSQHDRTEFLDTYPVEGTPTTMIFTNGILEEEMLVSVQEKVAITNFLKKYNLIK